MKTHPGTQKRDTKNVWSYHVVRSATVFLRFTLESSRMVFRLSSFFLEVSSLKLKTSRPSSKSTWCFLLKSSQSRVRVYVRQGFEHHVAFVHTPFCFCSWLLLCRFTRNYLTTCLILKWILIKFVTDQVLP